MQGVGELGDRHLSAELHIRDLHTAAGRILQSQRRLAHAGNATDRGDRHLGQPTFERLLGIARAASSPRPPAESGMPKVPNQVAEGSVMLTFTRIEQSRGVSP